MRLSDFGLVALVLAGCRTSDGDQRLAALEAEVAAMAAQQSSDLATTQADLQAEIDSLRTRLDAFDPGQAGLLAAEIDAIDATVAAISEDLTGRIEALEALAEGLSTRVADLEAADTATAEALVTLQSDVSNNYVTAASIEGVVRVSDLQPDYDNAATLIADLLDARERVAELEESGADAAEVTAVADALAELSLDVSGLSEVNVGLDGRLSAVEADYATASQLSQLQGDVGIISADYLRAADLTPVQDGLDTIAADYVSNGRFAGLQGDVGIISADYLRAADLAPVQDSLDTIAADYVSNGRFITLQDQVSDISSNYVNGDIFGILEADVNTIASDYLTSDDYIDLAEQLEGIDSLVLLDTPQIVRLSCAAATQKEDVAVPQVPADASALVANLYTFHDQRSDHVNHHFGRSVIGGTTWDNLPWERNIPMSDVSITHQGDLSGRFYYGQGHGSSLIPLKANGTFDASMCLGYSVGTHYVTIQVNGYYR